MNAYVCTYRQITPPPADLKRTEQAAAKDPLLRKFLKEYGASCFDWGDDPSFFAAKYMLGDVRRASWGVCRRDVRGDMKEGDVIIFFCGSKRNERKSWDYYFIGVGTVAGIVENRKLLWTKPAYAAYRTFYNILVDSDGKQFETFHPFHKDWELRAKAPYIVFDPAQSVFNLDSPHLVATWNGDGLQEIWRRDRQTRAIEQLLFVERDIKRRLRTSRTGYAHVKLNLLSDGKKDRPGRPILDLIGALTPLI